MNYLMAILAAYRLALMLATEEGPGGAFDAVRSRFDPEQETWLGRGLNCPKCISYWIALIAALMVAYLDADWNVVRIVLAWNAIAGGAIIVYSLVDER